MSSSNRPRCVAFSAFVTLLLFVEILSPFSFAQSFSEEANPVAQQSFGDLATKKAVASFASDIASAKAASFASTATPTPTPKTTTSSTVASSGACTVSKQSGSEVKLIWDSTLGFVGNEVNSLSDSALKTSDPTAFTNATNGGQVVINNYISTGSGTPANARVPVADVARLLGKSVDEVANDFSVDPVNGTISMQMFQAEMDKNSALSGYLSKFTSLLGSSAATATDNPAYTNYKVKLPNGKTLSLSDVFGLQDLNGQTDACLLDNSFIQGRVSYVAQLNKDLSVGFDRSSTTLKSNQHLTAESTLAALSLNGGNSIVVPKRFQNFVSALGTIMTVDTLFTVAESAYMLSQFKDYSSRVADDQLYLAKLDKAKAELAAKQDKLYYRMSMYGTDMVTPVDMFDEVAGGAKVASKIRVSAGNAKASQLEMFNLLDGSVSSNKDEFIKKLDDISNALTTEATKATGSTKQALTDRNSAIGKLKKLVEDKVASGEDKVAVTKFLNGNIGSGGLDDVYKTYGFTGPTSEYLDSKLAYSEYNYVYTDRYKLLSNSVMNEQEAIRNVLEGKLMSNFYFGFAWLSYGRLALSLAKGISLSSTGKLAPDNYLIIYINRNDVLSEFRSATDWAMSGRVMETISDFLSLGTPREAFGVGPMIIINAPINTNQVQSIGDSSTVLTYNAPSGYSPSWQVTSNWKGQSDATVFEDVRDDPEYARMPLYVSNMTLGTALNQNDMGAEVYSAIAALFPLVSWRLAARQVGGTMVQPIARLLVYDTYLRVLVDPTSFSKEDVCSDERVRNYITYYAAATALSQGSNVAQIGLGAEQASWIGTAVTKMKGALPVKSTNTYVSKASKIAQSVAEHKNAVNALTTFANIFAPTELLKGYVASEGLEYVRICKDTDYTIVGYQELDKKPKSSLASLTQKLNPLQSSSVIGNLSFGSALQGVGSSLSTEAMTEVINTRMTLESQSGMVRPSQLFYLHLDGASEVSWGIYNALDTGGCFRKCQDGATMAICETDSGTYIIDKATGAKTQISDRDRALMSTLMQDIAKTILPNTLISAQLACGSGDVIMTAGTDARVQASTGCATTSCLITQLANVAGRSISGGYISDVMGEVSAVKTTTGLALFEKGKPIRFIYTAGSETSVTKVSPLGPGYYDLGGIPISENSTQVTQSDLQAGALTTTKSKVGTEVTSPSADAQAAVDSGTLTNSEAMDSALLNINGDASVSLSGFTSGTNFEGVDAGELESIIFKRGRIEYDKVNNRLIAALYILGEADFAKSVKDVSVVATKNVNENGTNNAINVNFTSKAGMEDTVSELNTALSQVQGTGGMQMLETANTIYYFTKNAAGEDILKICDKKTSTCKEYRITGSISSDGSTITVPTESGTFQIGFGTNAATGYPEINVTGPGGFAELATLLAAKGQNGIFVFDPLTGLAKLLNGQDLSLSSDFASKGMSFYGTSTGTTGVAGNNYVGLARSSGTSSSSSSSPFSVPSVPTDNLPVAVLMLVALLGTVVAVRVYRK